MKTFIQIQIDLNEKLGKVAPDGKLTSRQKRIAYMAGLQVERWRKARGRRGEEYRQHDFDFKPLEVTTEES